jgi:hypothetical protein
MKGNEMKNARDTLTLTFEVARHGLPAKNCFHAKDAETADYALDQYGTDIPGFISTDSDIYGREFTVLRADAVLAEGGFDLKGVYLKQAEGRQQLNSLEAREFEPGDVVRILPDIKP